MSSRWPQTEQDPRSPYATYDEAWPQDGGGEQPWQDDGWQAQDQPGHSGQWAQDPYSGQWAQGSDWQGQTGRTAVAQAVAPARPRAGGRSRNEAADSFQSEWDQSGGGSGDDDDYAWFSYLSGGRSAEPKPDEGRSGRSGRDSARRGGRPEKSRSRRGRAREPEAVTGPSGPAATDPGYGPSATPSENVTTDRGLRRPAGGPAAAADPGRDRAGKRSRHGRAEPAGPGYGQEPAAGWQEAPGWSAAAEWSAAADQSPLPGWPAADSGYGRADAASWPAAGDPRQDHTPAAEWRAAGDSGQHQADLAGWPAAADRAPDHTHVAGWPAAGDARQDQAPEPGWAAADWRQDETPPAGWPAASDPRLDQGPVVGWPAADSALDQSHADWPAADDRAPGHGYVAGWPAAGDARQDEGHVAGWPAAGDARQDEGHVAGWPAAGDARQDQGPANGWDAAADQGYGQAATAAWAAADQSPVPGWPAADGGYQQADDGGYHQADAGYRQASATTGDTGYGWPAAADPQRDQAPVPGWPSAGPDYGWPADDDSGQTGRVGSDWPGTADAASAGDTGPAARVATMVKTRERALSAARAPVRDDDTGLAGRARVIDDTGFAARAPVIDDTGLAGPAPVRDDETALADPDTIITRSPGKQRTARKPAKRPGKQAVKKQPRGRAAEKAAAQDGPRLLSPPAPGEQPARQKSRPRAGRKTRGRLTTRVVALAGVSAIAAGAAAFVVLTRPGGGATHVITIPATLGAFSEQPQLAKQMHAAALRQQIIDQSAGEVHNVVYAVYQDGTGAAGSSGPQIILFIGGNLSGTSAGSFISAFTGKLQDAATTSAGPLGGAAACVPSVDGRVAECVWADNDTFGVVASQTSSSVALAAEMREMRPAIEHRASSRQ